MLLFPESRLFLLFVGFAALCVPFSYHLRNGIEFLIGFFIKFGLYLYFVAKIVRTEEEINGMLKTIMFGGFIMALSAILKSGMGGRIGGGSTYDPNDLAMILVTTLPIAIMQGLATNNRFRKIVCFGGGALNLVGLIATQSRGGFVGLVVLVLFSLFKKIPGVSRKRVIVLLSILGIFFGIYLGVEYKERILTIFDDSPSLSSGSGRILVWKRAVVMAKDHPILGVGPRSFQTAYGNYLEIGRFREELSLEESGSKWHTAHNSFLLVLVELGFPGLLIFLAINARSFRNLSEVKELLSDSSPPARLSSNAAGLQMGLVGFMACAFFLSACYDTLIYLTLILSGAMIRRMSVKESTAVRLK